MYEIHVSPLGSEFVSVYADGRPLAHALYCPGRKAWHDADAPFCAGAVVYPTWASCLVGLTAPDTEAATAILTAAKRTPPRRIT